MSLTTQQVGEQLRNFLSEHTPRESSGPVVLIWEMGGFPALLRKNAILAAALRLRGCRPHMIICDGTPLGCIRRGVEENDPLERWQHRCSACSLKCAQMAETYGVPFSRIGDYLTQDARDHFRQLASAISLEDILGFSHRGVAVGQLAWSSLNRYLKGYSFAVADLPVEYAAIYRQYFYAAIANTEAAVCAMQQLDPASVLTSHGVYADYAPALALAHLQGRAAMSWASGYADCLHYFTIPQDSNRVVVRGLSERAWLKRAAEPLTADEEALLDNFLHERYFKQGARDIEILSAPEDAGSLKMTLGIANNRPIVCLFAHVNWDACFDFSTMIFPTANDWVIESIRNMIALPEVNWIIRVHPGEIIDGSVFSTGDIIKQHFPQLPDHIKILWADSEVNSFGLYRLIDAGITIFGTVGAELTAMGKPVIVAGESHYSGKGFTRDGHSHGEYLQMLEQCSVMTPLTGDQTKLARQYAFSFFIQRQIPIRLTNGHMGDLDPAKMSLLLPGQDAVIDLICDHILDGEDIILEGPTQLTLELPGRKSLASELRMNILQCGVDNGGDKVWYQATGPQTVWGLTLQKTGPRFAIKVPQGVGAIPRTPSPKPDGETITSTQLQLEGFGRFEAKDWAGALRLFDKALAIQTSQGIHLMRARCLLSLQQPTQAREAVEVELRMSPNHPDALQLLREMNSSSESLQSEPTSSAPKVGPRFAIKVPGSPGTNSPQVPASRLVDSPREGLTQMVLDRTTVQPPTAELPTVSVVIPTYNRAKMLGITLESFVHQHYPKNRFEIVVADNNSGDETRQVVEEWQQRSAVPVKYVFEKRQGVHYARNTAAWQTSGDILYYTDDDMIASRELLEEIVKPFSMDPRVGSATGRILPQWEVLPPEWILKLCNNFRLSLNDLGEQMLIQEKDPGVYSCHMAMRRGIFFQSGGFNPENTAGEWIGDGETGLNIKIKELGYKFAYNGKAAIRHMIPPQRMTQEYLNKRLANQGNCDSYTDYKKHRYSEKQLIERIAGHQAKIVEHSAHYTARRLNNDLHWRMDRAFIDYYLNRVEYDHRLIHDAQWRELVLRYDWLNEEQPEWCEAEERASVSPLDEIRRSLEVLNGALA